MRGRRLLPAGIVAVAVALAAPAGASATQYFAAPGGVTSAVSCPSDAPCSLQHALALAVIPGDEVIVTPGDYDVGSTALTTTGINLHGVAGQPRPLVHGNPASGPLLNVVEGTTISHLALRQDGSGGVGGTSVALNGDAATLSDLVVQNAVAGGAALRLLDAATLAGSVAWASGPGGIAVDVAAAGATLHNVTAYATGGANSAGITSDGALPATITATNTIAKGATDLLANTPATFAMTSSNFSSTSAGATVTGAGNQSAPPSLANAGAGDFHEAAGSPTIDAGVPDPLAGTSDIDGQPRTLGAAPDIGADEYAAHPPIVATGAPAGVTTSAATLTGSVNPNGQPTTYRFEYGATPLYGSATPPQSAGSGSSDVPVSAPLTGLAPGSIVHYRLDATNADGTTSGLDRILIVLGSPPTVTTTGPQLTGVTLPGNSVTPTVGQPTVLTVRGSDPQRPVSGVTINFGEAGQVFAETACRLKPRQTSGPFAPGSATTFKVPYTFTTPGVHQVQITLTSGSCRGTQRTSTQTIQLDAQRPAAKPAAGAARRLVAATGCTGENLVPSTTNIKLVQKATLCLLNQQRTANGLDKLRTNKKLIKAARIHTKAMLRGHFFAHQGPGEPNLFRRLAKVRYPGGGGENLGLGVGVPYATPASMVAAWMASPVHRANILERRFHTIGIVIAAAKPTPPPPTPGATYTTEFGSTRR